MVNFLALRKIASKREVSEFRTCPNLSVFSKNLVLFFQNLEVTVSHVQKTCQGCYQNSREKETHQFSTYLLIRDGQLQRNLQKTFATPKKSSAPCRSCGAGEPPLAPKPGLASCDLSALVPTRLREHLATGSPPLSTVPPTFLPFQDKVGSLLGFLSRSIFAAFFLYPISHFFHFLQDRHTY
ncbi:Protein CBG00238 [Caenorhabditis briggsae]|uniref:Protein CBG00238 n=1 Tax=Caenorhabditis briggsae TaxID=6238 RepID=A8WMI9_CAEBR|nr:Protein CBG00238 [Caenorhabditis briggsae]CAP21694.1 Protein CBG00238 [Caenorhabditis briggsae]